MSNRRKIIIKKSSLNEACKIHRDDKTSGMNEDKLWNDIDKMIDEKIVKADAPTDTDVTRTVMRKNKRRFKSTMAIVACAALCALAITGGVTKLIEPMSQSTTSSAINSGQNGLTQEQNEPMNEPKTITTEEEVQLDSKDPSDINSGSIAMSGGSQKTNYTNPTKITLNNSNVDEKTCTWKIADYKTKNILSTGKGNAVTTHLNKMIKNKENGSYQITFNYKDKEGNEIEIHGAFVIKVKAD